jgi:hypothetical protein
MERLKEIELTGYNPLSRMLTPVEKLELLTE